MEDTPRNDDSPGEVEGQMALLHALVGPTSYDDHFEGVLGALALLHRLYESSDPDKWLPLLTALADGGYHASRLLEMR